MKRDNRGRFVRKPTTRVTTSPEEQTPPAYFRSSDEMGAHEDWAVLPQLIVAAVFALFVGVLVARCAVHGLPSAVSMPTRLSQDPSSRTP